VTGPAERALPVRRARIVEEGALRGVVVEVDATEDPRSLAVLQASLHELPDGERLIHGYRVASAGLGAWVGDRRVRITIWPATVDAAGEIHADDPDDPDADILVIDVDPLEHGEELLALARLGRLFVAGPEMGPTPLVLDVDRELVDEVVSSVLGTGSA
jgi:hypothetical protein